MSTVDRYRRQQAEWHTIRTEMIVRQGGRTVAPVEVTKEQIRRMGARGEKRVTLRELAEG